MTDSTSHGPRFRILWPATGVVVALFVVFGVLWALLATGLRDVALDWIDNQQRQGWVIVHDTPRIHDFPRWPQVEFKAVSITAPPADGGWTWQTDALTLVPDAFDLTGLTVHAPGRHTVRWLEAGDTAWTLDAANAFVGVGLDLDGRWQTAVLSLEEAELSDALDRPLTGVGRLDTTLTVRSADAATGGGGDEDVFARFTGDVDDLRMAINLGPFARTVRTARLDADLVGPIQPGRLSEALDAWRRGGGTLEVRRLLLDWPPLTIDADGTLALDDRLQPIGAFSTRITGFNETLETMESQGVIDSGQTASAQIILGLMANTSRGGEPELSVPVSVQNQRLSVGPLELLEVPEVRWD